MIQMETVLSSGDNSGAKSLKCIKVLGGSRKMSADVGDIIVVGNAFESEPELIKEFAELIQSQITT